MNNSDLINTTIKRNSDGRVSFKGGAPFLHKAAEFVSYSPLIAEALFALFITCGARPLTIMATAKNAEEKEKCSYQAAKSVSSGIVGLVMTALVGSPIAAATKQAAAKGSFDLPKDMQKQAKESVKKGVELLDDLAKNLTEQGKDVEFAKHIKDVTLGGKINFSKLFASGKKADKVFVKQIREKAPHIADDVAAAINSQKVLKSYSSTAKNVMDKLFQPAFMPLRATITVALVPVLLSLVGKKKPVSKPKNEDPFAVLRTQVFQTPEDNKVFQSFAGVAKNANK